MTQTLRPAIAPVTAHRLRARLMWLLVCVIALAAVVAASLALGARDIPLARVFEAFTGTATGETDHLVVLEQRLPRTLVGILVGAALGLAGTLMQGITRNPLADPGLLGVNAGASLFVVLAIATLGVTSPAGYIWFAFAGAAAATVVVYGVAAVGRGGATPVKLALAGMALTAGVTSVLTLVLLTDTTAMSTYRFWAVGSLAGRGAAGTADTLGAVAPFLAVGAVLAFACSRWLNVLSMGDELAHGLGVHVPRARALSMLAAVLLAGSATALAGPIAFVGLVVPHLIRPLTGPDYRWILAYALVLGPTLLLAADVVGRLIAQPGELEAGLVVALLGAPVMIAIVRKAKVAGL
ncbi:MAG TPA: iron ABC transporter permease [Beutenbergiaceae bacterium]|nr:iron ABC transporter permease [Beutenbergiaceae bacterium]